MTENDKNTQNTEEKHGRGFGYASFCLAIAAVIFFPLMFVISVYGIFASALCSLAALAFYNSQKPRGLFALVKAAKIIAYVMLALCFLILLGGIIYSATI